VLFANGDELRRTGPHLDASRAVVTDIGDVGGLVDDGVVVDIVHYRCVHVVDGAVIGEVVVVPVAALISESNVAEAVVDAAIVADVAAPITAVEAVTALNEAPVAGSPQCSLVRRGNPRTGNPIVAFRCVVPIAGGPDIAVSGSRRLFVLR
jgi:hypothetical protein